MQRYRFQFDDAGGLAAEAIESDHSSVDDAMCDAARTVAEMLKEQAGAGPTLEGFSLSVRSGEGSTVGAITVVITRMDEAH